MMGIRSSVSIIENERPNMMAKASGPHNAEAPASGSIPTTVVMVVRKMGRNRDIAASTMTSFELISGREV